MVWMRQMHVLVIITRLFHLAYQVVSCKIYEARINNMHVSMQALPATTRDSRALFDDTIRRGGPRERTAVDGREESDERGKAQKKEEKTRSS